MGVLGGYITFFRITLGIKNLQNWKQLTFIPGIGTQSTAVPVAFERNSVKVSSAIARSLKKNGRKVTYKVQYLDHIASTVVKR
jgi:hypothetical protein